MSRKNKGYIDLSTVLLILGGIGIVIACIVSVKFVLAWFTPKPVAPEQSLTDVEHGSIIDRDNFTVYNRNIIQEPKYDEDGRQLHGVTVPAYALYIKNENGSKMTIYAQNVNQYIDIKNNLTYNFKLKRPDLYVDKWYIVNYEIVENVEITN